MTKRIDVLIAGAGMGGLTTALALIKSGLSVKVLEQTAVLQEVGAGLQLSPNAVRVLDLLGLHDEIRSFGFEPTGKELRLWNTGETWPLFDLAKTSRARYGSPYIMAHRADLHRALTNAVLSLQPDAIQLNAKCIDVATSSEGHEIELSDGTRHHAKVIVAADGIKSVLRSKLIAEDAPTYSGCVAWRAVIPMARLPNHLQRPVGVNWVGPGAHIVNYPLRSGELMNFGGVVEKACWGSESWVNAGSVEECLSDFGGWHEDVHTMIRAAETHYKFALMVREPNRNWVNGNVALLGDAAHPTLPFLAQGAAMAIEDGYVLSRCLKAAGLTGEALNAYQEARVDRTTKVVLGSAENAKRFHSEHLRSSNDAKRYVESQWQPSQVEGRYSWLFEYQADSAPILLPEVSPKQDEISLHQNDRAQETSCSGAPFLPQV